MPSFIIRGECVQENNNHYLKVDKNSVISKRNAFFSVDGISDDEFWCIIELCAVRSDKVIKALYEYMVLKHSRSISCNNNGVSNGYFGCCLARIEHVIRVVSKLIAYNQVRENQ
ncbi:TPA: fimbrial protein [Escherichia coli]|nr:fimbrial protein [Escherichia coli]HBA7189041.1 fimbrial protein [Escherichia coli]